MQTKLLELRDDGTFIPLLCVNMNPSSPADATMYPGWTDDQAARRYLLERCGYPCDGRPNIAITNANADGDPFRNDYLAWSGRTYPVAHKYILENWEKLKDGDVVDVEYILGETAAPKVSERLTVR